jgi:signal transduction histidine kinase
MFLAHMSHEIRTPLNAVIGLSQLLSRMELPERALTFVGQIGHAGEQLLALTNDVLDISKIEAGELHLKRQPFELSHPCWMRCVPSSRLKPRKKPRHCAAS